MDERTEQISRRRARDQPRAGAEGVVQGKARGLEQQRRKIGYIEPGEGRRRGKLHAEALELEVGLVEFRKASAIGGARADIFVRQIGAQRASDEGLMIQDIEECLAVVTQALKKCDLPPSEVIAWCAEMAKRDRVGFIFERELGAIRNHFETLRSP